MLAVSSIKFHQSPSFGLYLETVKDDNDNIIYRNDTALFRNDLDFDKLVNFLDNKYKSADSVNVIAHACSDGEESYSLAAVLDFMLGNKAEKFLPLIAKDIDAKSVERAKQGIFYMTYDEYNAAEYFLNDKIKDYFTAVPKYEIRTNRPERERFFGVNYSVNDKVLNKINFEQGNILNDVENIDFKNTVLFARNFWPYLSKGEIDYLIKTLASRMDNSSTLVIGDYDSVIVDRLKDNGFIETEVKNVFEIPKKHEESKHHDIYSYQTNSIYY